MFVSSLWCVVVPHFATLTGAHPTPRGGGGYRGACGGHRPSSGDLPLQVDEPFIFPSVPLPFGHVRLDVAGPTTIPAVGVEPQDSPGNVVMFFSVGDVNSTTPAGRAEFDGAGCCH